MPLELLPSYDFLHCCYSSSCPQFPCVFLLCNFFFLLVISPLKIVLQTEKMELEATVVDETKERDSYCGQGNRRYSG